jgi:hypothetical protein
MNLERLLEGILNFFHANVVNLRPTGFRLFNKVIIKWIPEEHELFVGYISYTHDDGWVLLPNIDW